LTGNIGRSNAADYRAQRLRRTTVTVFGWDASDLDWDCGPMDLVAARAAGIDFFMHRATEGTRVKHTRLGEALRRASDAGIPVLGAYGIPRTPGKDGHGAESAQVDYFLSYVDQEVPWWRDWPHWLWQVHLEHCKYDKVAPAYGLAWCDLLTRRTGRRVVLYAPKWAYGNRIGGSWPLWQASYGSNPATALAAAYPGDSSAQWADYCGRTPVILQYGSRTTIGRQPRCAANAFRGTIAELLAFVGGPAGTFPPSSPRKVRTMLKLAKIKGNDAVVVGDGLTCRPVRTRPHLLELQADIAAAGGDPTVREKDTWEDVYDIVGQPRIAPIPAPSSVAVILTEENLVALADKLGPIAEAAAARVLGHSRPAAPQI
jgi:GH25 family lysozyme M1 (1,4-beta-N-acetylmuramidase)